MAQMNEILMSKAGGLRTIAQVYGLAGGLKRRGSDAKQARAWLVRAAADGGGGFEKRDVQALSDVAAIELRRGR